MSLRSTTIYCSSLALQRRRLIEMVSYVKYFSYICTTIYLLKIHHFNMFVFASFNSPLLILFYLNSNSVISMINLSEIKYLFSFFSYF